MIEPGQIPQIQGDLDAVSTHGQSLRSTGTNFATTGEDVNSTWQGLAAFYKAPESGVLLTAMVPVKTRAGEVGADLGTVGTALVTYADTVRPLQAQLKTLQSDAQTFRSQVDGDDDWNKDQGKVDENNRLLSQTNAAMAAWMAAQRACANTIDALFGGPQYVQDNGDGTAAPNEFGYSADQLDQALNGDDGLPWGKPEERDKPWYEDTWDAVASFGKGFGADGAWGDIKGLGNLVGFGGWSGLKTSWTGIAELGLIATPTGGLLIGLNQSTALPGLKKGQLGEDYKNMGKGLLAWDEWKKDPARALGNVTWNVVSIVFGTKGTGAALKVGKVGMLTEKLSSTVGRVTAKLPELKVPKLRVAGTDLSHLDTSIKTDIDATPHIDAGTPHLDAPPVEAGGPHVEAGTPHEPAPVAHGSGDPGAHPPAAARTEPAPAGSGSGGHEPGTHAATKDPTPAHRGPGGRHEPTAADHSPRQPEHEHGSTDSGGRTEDPDKHTASGKPPEREPATVGAPAREGAGAADGPPAEHPVLHDASDISGPKTGHEPATPHDPPTPHHPGGSADHGPTAGHEPPGGRHAAPESSHVADHHVASHEHSPSGHSDGAAPHDPHGPADHGGSSGHPATDPGPGPGNGPQGARPHPELTGSEKTALDDRLTGLEHRYPDDYHALEYDPDKGSISPPSQDEARVALDLRERGILPDDVTRPPGAGEGDYYSPSLDQHYDLKGLHSHWPPFNTARDTARPFPGAYRPGSGQRFLAKIEDQLASGRTPIIDTRNANQAAINDLARLIDEKGWEGKVVWYP